MEVIATAKDTWRDGIGLDFLPKGLSRAVSHETRFLWKLARVRADTFFLFSESPLPFRVISTIPFSSDI